VSTVWESHCLTIGQVFNCQNFGFLIKDLSLNNDFYDLTGMASIPRSTELGQGSRRETLSYDSFFFLFNYGNHSTSWINEKGLLALICNSLIFWINLLITIDFYFDGWNRCSWFFWLIFTFIYIYFVGICFVEHSCI